MGSKDHDELLDRARSNNRKAKGILEKLASVLRRNAPNALVEKLADSTLQGSDTDLVHELVC